MIDFDDNFLRTSDVISYLKISRSTLINLIKYRDY